MSDRVTDFLIELAENENVRAAYEAAPDAAIAARGFTAEEAAALRSGDDARIFALYTERRSAPVVAKIIWTSDDEPAGTSAVAKIIWTSDDEPAETPAVAKIIWTSDDDEADEAKRFAKCA